MASDVIKVEFMTKRSVMKGRFKSENYKGRWFVLTPNKLSYYEGKVDQANFIPDSKHKQKGAIALSGVRVVEKTEPEFLSDKPNAFQITYIEEPNNEPYTLYIVALTREARDDWIDAIRSAAEKCGAPPYSHHHYATYNFKDRRWTCCEKISKQAQGCRESTWKTSSSSKRKDAPLPVPEPVPQPRQLPETPQQAQDKVIAVYDYTGLESDDLSLEKGETYEILEKDQEYWWKARNSRGEVGFIPSNYVKSVEGVEGDQLEQYDWYYPNTSRKQCEDILEKERREGCFLLRNSSSKGMYTLSIYAKEGNEGLVKHYHIKIKGNGDYYLTERHAFSKIPDLINYHKHNCAGLIVRLRSSPQQGRQSLVPTTALGHDDKYELDRTELVMQHDLGRGQFGVVKLALWKGHRKVAVKMMNEHTMSEDDFIDEAKTMKELTHKNLVKLYGVCSTEKPIFIVTEFMKHGSLLAYLRKHKLILLRSRIPTLIEMCFQVSEAMAYLESMSFIHRDLAARNCLVGEGDVCKVGDFGLARFVLDDEYTSSQGTKFPIRWAAPEVLTITRFSTKSDVWAYGILVWEIFTGGDLPYGKVSNHNVVTRVCHQNSRLEKPAKCPENIYEIMLACWEEKPDQRPDFKSIRQELDDLQKETFDYAE